MIELSPPTVRAINIAVLSFCSLILLVILLSYPRFKLKNRASGIFYAKMLVSACMIVCYDVSFINGPEKTDALNVIMRSLAYVGIYAVYVLYILYITEMVNRSSRDKKIPETIIYASVSVGVVGALLWILSLFSPALSELNTHQNGFSRIFFIGHIGGIILIFISLILLIRYRRMLGYRETMALLSMPVLMGIATICEPISQGIELRYPAAVVEFLIVYTQHHMELEVRHEREEAEGLQKRLNITAGRMKSHFLYNVLTTIYYLCETEPEEAQRAVKIFSDYMKSTLEAVEKQELVEFSWELEEIKNYLMLEEIRFGDKLKVEYDIEYEDFLIPPLTVQPLVENAVIHGIGSKVEGGTIKITSRKLSDDGAQIRVRDDGVGFDIKGISGMDPDEGDIPNLMDRLLTEVGGELTITSSPDKGTTSIITIRPNAMAR